jgi:hypothetical protein
VVDVGRLAVGHRGKGGGEEGRRRRRGCGIVGEEYASLGFKNMLKLFF